MALDPYQSTHTGEEIDAGIELAETSIQPSALDSAISGKANTSDLGNAAYQDSSSFATSSQGVKADSAVQPAELTVALQPKANTADLGSAAFVATSSLATSSQGAKADSAVQPATMNAALALKANTADLGSAAFQPTSSFATSAQGAKADAAVQPAALMAGLETKIDTSAVPAAILSQVLTAISFATATAITAADSVLSAFGKLQAQITTFVDKVNVFTKAQRGAIAALTPSANVYTPDSSASNFFSFTPAANFTLANMTNLPAVGVTQSGSIFITQPAAGNITITFGNNYKFQGGVAFMLSTAANSKDRIDYIISSTGEIQVTIGKDIK